MSKSPTSCRRMRSPSRDSKPSQLLGVTFSDEFVVVFVQPSAAKTLLQ